MIDNHFKFKMQNHTSKYSEDLWDNIALELPVEKKKSKYFILFFFILFAILSVWTLMEVLEDQTQISNSNIEYVQNRSPWNKAEFYNRSKIKKVSILKSIINQPIQNSDKSFAILVSDKQSISNVQENINEDENIEKVGLRIMEEVPYLVKSSKPKTLVFSRNIGISMTDPKGECPKFNNTKKYPSLIVGINSNMALPYRTLSSDVTQLPINKINEATSPRYSKGFGVSVGVNLNKKFTIGTGINFQQINENFIAQIVDSSQVRITTITDYVYEGGYVVDSVMRTEEEYSSVENHNYKNKERLIAIPLSVSYTINPKAKTRFAIKTGAQVTFSQPVVAYSFNPNSDALVNTVANDANQKMKFKGFGAFAGLQIQKSIGRNSILYVEPNVRYMSYKNQNTRNQIFIPGLSIGYSFSI